MVQDGQDTGGRRLKIIHAVQLLSLTRGDWGKLRDLCCVPSYHWTKTSGSRRSGPWAALVIWLCG
ncbi:hypothetical protein MGG_17394 [Pyricularia oryzae 70-15]|uniref:Uncharacterized protein n=3 Tax=Pyricularia oryzae TaxID=318829 RepID=G4NF07_PYRO7|nr:uncharacterized protein MGG_17394 [Pyricularia oryzae 70-15]EHA48733.1 hypothetical protein MGG_17394 [Pyricularia oryzae 70-15]ELQ36030.1 hypothetical protein OOU_Y34scaffold00669g15 [Pyricularia oryzae Y34]